MAGTDMESFTTFGDLLKYLRRRARMTQRELGIAVGYSESQITRLESGQREPDAIMVEHQFVEALDLKRDPEAANRLIALAKNAPVVDANTIAPVAPAIPNNLPVQLTRFIGREPEVAEVKNLLDAHRLVTLTGSGGIGKTRLTLEVAGGVLDQYKDGVWLVELAPLADPALLPRTVANVLGLQEQRDTPILDAITDYLRDKQLLLILDNCEHLIDACARLAEGVLKQSRDVRILASSREALGIVGEIPWRVPSLPMAEAVNLFVERAHTVAQTFALTPATTTAVELICARLDGIPLAIELAAARVRALPVEKIAERLNDRFRLLTGGSRTALPRQQTLRGAIDWSYSLLTEPERTLLRRLAVFVGGWTLEAAEAVCSEGLDDVLDTLTRLVDKSLVTVDDNGRYTLLETIRQYAREKLADADEGSALRDGHLDFFVKIAETEEGELWRGQPAALDHIETEVDNIRAALEWTKETLRVNDGLRLAAALMWFWVIRGHQAEGLEWLQTLLAMPCEQENTAARAWAYIQTSDMLSRYTDDSGRFDLIHKAKAIATKLGLRRELAHALLRLGNEAFLQGNRTLAHQYAQQSLDIGRAMNDKVSIQNGLWSMARDAHAEGDDERSERLMDELLGMDPDDLMMRTSTARYRGYGHLDKGEVTDACARFRQSLVGNAKAGDRQAVAACFCAFGGVAITLGDFERAAKLLAAAMALSETIHTPLMTDDRERYERYVAEVSAKLNDATLKSAWAEGRAMTMQQAIEYALQE